MSDHAPSIGDVGTHGFVARPADDPALRPGDMAGEYRILRLLGRGGMGEVYAAENLVTKKRVALKVIPGSAAGGSFVERFRLEARVMQDLRHPHLVQVHHAGELASSSSTGRGGIFYLTMDLVTDAEGRTRSLQTILEQKRADGLAESEIRRYALQICDALSCVHAHGIVHRDLKPANVLLDDQGNVRVSDFGLVKIVGGPVAMQRVSGSGDVSLSGALTMGGGEGERSLAGGAPLGTMGYMSPEQRSGQSVDARSDIFSVGVVLYVLLAGRLPEGRYKPPSAFGRARGWDAIIDRCLAPSPEDRYPSVASLRSDIEGVNRAPHPARAPVWIVGGLLAMSLAGAAWWLQQPTSSPEADPRPTIPAAREDPVSPVDPDPVEPPRLVRDAPEPSPRAPLSSGVVDIREHGEQIVVSVRAAGVKDRSPPVAKRELIRAAAPGLATWLADRGFASDRTRVFHLLNDAELVNLNLAPDGDDSQCTADFQIGRAKL